MSTDEVVKIIKLLKKTYPDAKCSLNFETPFELAIAVLLSAQCTDERVNKNTPALFLKYNKPEDFVNLDISIIEEIIHPCGFYKNKAKNIKNMSIMLLEQFNGSVPQNMDDLMKLPGIGRKSANVIMLEAFNKPQGIAVDTHAKRISNRLGLSNNTDPLKIEQDLLKIIPYEYLKDVNHLFMWLGRDCCQAPNPNCENCILKDNCTFHKN